MNNVGSVMYFPYYWHMFEAAKLLGNQLYGLLIMQKHLMPLSLPKSLTVVQHRCPKTGCLLTASVWQGSCQSFQNQTVHPLCYRTLGFKRTFYLQDLSVALLPARVVFCHITFEDTFFAKSLFR
jgi:hypothetical protein